MPEPRTARPLLPALILERGRPLVPQIVAHVRGAIAAGRLAAGARLPSIRALAATLGVNRNTAAQAIRELAEQGYIYTRFGGGSLVQVPPPPPASMPGPALHRHASPGPLGHGTAAGAPFSAAGRRNSAELSADDWERRFAGWSQGLLAAQPPQPLATSANGSGARAINLYQQRPVTELFPLREFRACLDAVLKRSGRSLLNYGSPSGYLPLREAIAERLRSAGTPAEARSVLIVSGSQQGIDLLARALLEPGDGVLVESPTYSIALRLFAAAGARLISYPVGRAGVGLDALRALEPLRPPKLCYAVPNFQNPTTHSYTLEEKRTLLAEAARLDTVVVEDATDVELHADPTAHPSLAALEALDAPRRPSNSGASGRVVYLNSFSKTLVPAVRVGYLAAPPPLLRRLTELKEMTDLSHSLILQAAITEFMAAGHYDAHVERVRRHYRQRMERVLQMLRETLPVETPFTEPESGLGVWVDLPAHLNPEGLFEELREQGVLVSPGGLYQPGPRERNGLRLSVTSEDEARLSRGFAIVGQVLGQALRRPPPSLVEQEYQSIH